MVMVAKGNDLPDSANGLMHFYLRQMVLTQEEINAEFSKLARKENIAKRDAWLSMGKKSRAKDGKGDLFSIIDKEAQKDIIATGSYMGAMVDRT